MSSVRLWCVAVAGAMVVLQAQAREARCEGLNISFQRVADNATLIPGSDFTFSQFMPPSLDGDNVAFNGDSLSGNVHGIYLARASTRTASTNPTGSGPLITVVDTNTQIPGEPPGVTFITLSGPSLSGGKVAFGGAYDISPVFFEGLLLWKDGALSIVAHDGDPIPDQPGQHFIYFFTGSLSGNELGFASVTSVDMGLFSALGGGAGGLHTLANHSTTVPGTRSSFSNFCPNPTFDRGVMAFCGSFNSGASSGVFRVDDRSGIALIADNSTAAPGGGTFMSFDDSPTICTGRIAFRALTSDGRRGVYLAAGTGVELVADTTTPIPQGTGTFTLFPEEPDGPALNGHGDIAFRALGSSGQRGVYTTFAGGVGGDLSKVIASGDSLDGRAVLGAFIGREAFSHNRIALLVTFTDGSSGIYIATLSVSGDITGDGEVDIDDLLLLLQAWGECPPPPQSDCPADLAPPPPDGDGAVNVDDLLNLLQNWT